VRLLLDENVPTAALPLLRSSGHDAVHVAEVMTSANYESVLALAASEDRVLVTFDRDFGGLVFARRLKAPPGIILLRLLPRGSEELARLLLDLMSDADRHWTGRFSVIERNRVRQRPLRQA